MTPFRRALFVLALMALSFPTYAGEDYSPLVEKLRPSVVNIQAVQGEDASLGSGFFVEPELIITNHHVVEGAGEVRVVLADRRTLRAKVIGRDKRTDLALLRVERAPKTLIPLPLGDSDSLHVGEPVIAIGNPFGLGSTVTAGILSATGRNLGDGVMAELLQTDASINPGNSGGPLFNARGEVIGISTAVVENGQGIGFAIPVNTARGVIQQLASRGYVVRGWIGVDVQDLTPELARAFSAPPSGGALVSAVDQSGPAASAGLQVGDVVVGWSDKAVGDSARFPRWVSETRPGSRVALTVLRKGERRQVTVKVATLRGDNGGPPEVEPTPASTKRPIGIDAEPSAGGGLVVTRVDPKGSLATAIAVGDEILDVDRQRVTTVDGLEKAVRSHRGGPLLLRVRRDAATVFVPVDL
jgi:serine protease Do